MMLAQLTPEKVIDIVKLSVTVSVCWPLRSNASKLRVFTFRALQIGSVISSCMLFFPLVYSAYLHYDDVVIVSKCICLAFGVLQIFLQTIICSTQYDRFQRVIEEMAICVKEARDFEKKVFEKYLDKCKIFYGGSMLLFYACAFIFAAGPIVLPAPFPSEAEYPFRVDYLPMNVIVYSHQVLISFQWAAHMCISGFGALLLWFTAARFECLILEMQEIKNIRMLIDCIRKQLRLRRYARDVVAGVRLTAVSAVIMSTFALTLCCITLITNTPFIMKMQFLQVCFTILLEIYMYAWPADYMKEMSLHIAQSAYKLRWYGQTLEIQKTVLYMLACQEPVTVSVSCILPELSLRYYCSYLSNAFSVFTALRVVLEED